METVLITGVAGFIGSHLAEKLLEQKYRVIGIDSFTNFYSKNIKKNNLNFCLKHENFSFINKDLTEIDLLPFLNKSKYLFHLAAQPGTRNSWGLQFGTYVKENILVTQRILEYAKISNSLQKIIVASSSSVYGEQNGKMNEENTRTFPISPYGVTKLSAENLCMVYAKNFNLPITSLRYFTVYGPRQRPDMAFMRFILSALTKNKITIYGDGNQSRDFTYIDDVITASISSMNDKSANEIFNIGGGFVISVNDILEKLKDILTIELDISYEPKQKGDVLHTESDISKAAKLIQYHPKIKINEGLELQVNFVKNHMNLYT